jgi:hypothetical protein
LSIEWPPSTPMRQAIFPALRAARMSAVEALATV